LELLEIRTFESKHPLILPSHEEAVKLLIRKEHKLQLHGGVNHTFASLRKRFFIIRDLTTVRRVILKCIICQKSFKKSQNQKMPSLPADQLDVCVLFEATGADFFGPFNVIYGGRATTKRWVLLLMCMTCRAIHFEALKDMTSQTTINAILRFQARRPGLLIIYYDNGTNFVGSWTELSQAVEAWNNSEMVEDLRLRGVEWKFGPLAARMVRSTKKHLNILLTKEAFDSDVFNTVLGGVESMLNNRPLMYASADSRDPEVLTPFNFMCPGVTVGSTVHVIPPTPPGDGNNLRNAWQKTRGLMDEFW
jgi:hypothetical protein